MERPLEGRNIALRGPTAPDDIAEERALVRSRGRAPPH